MDWDDIGLLAAVRDGSERAFNTLIDRHQQAVRTFLRGLTANHSDADDIAQETFLAAWTQARSFRGQGSVRAWLFSIAWRKVKGSQRQWFRAARRDTAYHQFFREKRRKKRLPKTVSTPKAQRDRCSLIQRQGQAPGAAGYTHAAAAEMLAIPLGTIKSYVLRGREKLRAILGEAS